MRLADVPFTCRVCGKAFRYEEIAGRRLKWGLDDTLTEYVLCGCPACLPPEKEIVRNIAYRPISQEPAIYGLRGTVVGIDGVSQWNTFSGKVPRIEIAE